MASLALGLLAVGLLFSVGMPQAPHWLTASALTFAFAALLWAAVQGTRDRRRFEAALAEHSAADAVLAERLAIARDIHDIVSNGMGLVTLRASVASRLAERDPAGAPEALRDIERVSRATTVELRRMLHVLRGDSEPTLEPAPTLSGIPALIDLARTAGLDVDYAAEGAEAHSEGVALTAHRLVQEGLGNAARHAGPTQVDVTLAREGQDLHVSVVDCGPRGPWMPRPGAGHGLIGLTERVASIGGTLEFGSFGRGWRLDARLPDPAELTGG